MYRLTDFKISVRGATCRPDSTKSNLLLGCAKELDKQSFVVTNGAMETGEKGIYTISGINVVGTKQASRVESKGATAAFIIRNYLGATERSQATDEKRLLLAVTL